ncbi:MULTISPECIES: hypothetical protein [Enterococcus]|uniref:Uncharacterized protein n=1 Tax=Enterococcus casseliflavus TaxID=37734 RepID=A0A415ES92_ENTCA|nr:MULTISPECIES: hypothetical protein [Enterococcus]MBW9322780.1 hypothetical protein [Enterococcus casseliflavus]RHK06169.1 hypothetical protein DW084_10530 [Enterococcus casseliflavus]TPE08394.1 hypothetical protein FJP08_01635 [Enterococcus sp. PF-3]TPE29485.1 hypothetical protein FJO98_01635 [Enterococcus sp. PF-2]
MDKLFDLDVEVVKTNTQARSGIGTLGVYCFTTGQGVMCSSGAGSHSCMTSATRCTGTQSACAILPSSLKK